MNVCVVSPSNVSLVGCWVVAGRILKWHSPRTPATCRLHILMQLGVMLPLVCSEHGCGTDVCANVGRSWRTCATCRVACRSCAAALPGGALQAGSRQLSALVRHDVGAGRSHQFLHHRRQHPRRFQPVVPSSPWASVHPRHPRSRSAASQCAAGHRPSLRRRRLQLVVTVAAARLWMAVLTPSRSSSVVDHADPVAVTVSKLSSTAVAMWRMHSPALPCPRCRPSCISSDSRCTLLLLHAMWLRPRRRARRLGSHQRQTPRPARTPGIAPGASGATGESACPGTARCGVRGMWARPWRRLHRCESRRLCHWMLWLPNTRRGWQVGHSRQPPTCCAPPCPREVRGMRAADEPPAPLMSTHQAARRSIVPGQRHGTGNEKAAHSPTGLMAGAACSLSQLVVRPAW